MDKFISILGIYVALGAIFILISCGKLFLTLMGY